jgi:3-methyladenine DNA glycosylase AlkD
VTLSSEEKTQFVTTLGIIFNMDTLHPYILPLKALFEANAAPAQAKPMAAYMRDQFAYLGIKTPQSVALQQQFYAEQGLPPVSELDGILRELWSLPQREFQYVAIGLLGKFEKKLPPGFIETMEFLIVTKSWWDTVDSIAGGPLGVHFKRYPEVRAATLEKWRQADNFWLRRACILFQLNYKNETDFRLLGEIIRENLGSREFFINKAIGWALRQYSRVDAQAVREFVAQTPLQPLSAREALKWLEKRNPG